MSSLSDRQWQYLTLQRNQRVLEVTFATDNRANALSHALLRELTELAQSLQFDSELSAVILSGTADTFSAGMDLRDPELQTASRLSLAQRRQLVKLGPAMCAAWEALEPVTIVAIEGWCIGGAAALAVSCDWRVAAENAHIIVPELKLGMNMSWQSVPRFIQLIGPAKTKQLLILAEPLDMACAERWGLVDHVTPAGGALDRAREIAQSVAAMPPVPVRMAKRAITEAASALNSSASFMDGDQFLLAQSSDDAEEGLAAFLQKRQAKFSGN